MYICVMLCCVSIQVPHDRVVLMFPSSLSVHLHIYPSVCMSVCLSVTLCTCAFRLRQEVLSRTSPQLVSLFTTCAFILVQVEVMKEGLTYTRLDWTRPPYEQQLQRLAVCKRLLLAVELSSGLEGAELCLQAVVMCYGMLAPLIQHQLMAPPLAKVWACVCVYIRTYVRTVWAC